MQTTSALPLWLLWVQALSVPALAIIGAVIAYRQVLIARVKLQHDLYDRRIKVYRAVNELVAEIAITGKVTSEDIGKFWEGVREAQFLYPRTIQKVIEEIGHEAFVLSITLNRVKNATSQADLEKQVEREGSQSEKLHRRLTKLGPMFDPYLHIGPL